MYAHFAFVSATLLLTHRVLECRNCVILKCKWIKSITVSNDSFLVMSSQVSRSDLIISWKINIFVSTPFSQKPYYYLSNIHFFFLKWILHRRQRTFQICVKSSRFLRALKTVAGVNDLPYFVYTISRVSNATLVDKNKMYTWVGHASAFESDRRAYYS